MDIGDNYLSHFRVAFGLCIETSLHITCKFILCHLATQKQQRTNSGIPLFCKVAYATAINKSNGWEETEATWHTYFRIEAVMRYFKTQREVKELRRGKEWLDEGFMVTQVWSLFFLSIFTYKSTQTKQLRWV